MLPTFFDSVLDLIVKTSTELPPDVRAAMTHALDAQLLGLDLGKIEDLVDEAEEMTSADAHPRQARCLTIAQWTIEPELQKLFL